MSVMLLNGNRVSSDKIEAAGYKFNFPDIDSALKDLNK
jgi:NAD dependent epimerase/dehydratase family enzyme